MTVSYYGEAFPCACCETCGLVWLMDDEDGEDARAAAPTLECPRCALDPQPKGGPA